MTSKQKVEHWMLMAVSLVISLVFSSALSAATFLEIDAADGERLFGKDLLVTDADGRIHLEYIAEYNYLSGGFSLNGQAGPDNYNIQMVFYHGAERAMKVGAYLNARGTIWLNGQLEPSIDVHPIGVGRSCIENTGEFIVYEFEPDAVPPRFAINFTQSCGHNESEKIYGILRINSDYPKNDNKPIVSIEIQSKRAVEGEQYVLDARSTRALQGEIINYHWYQISGPEVEFVDAVSNQAVIKLPQGLPLGGDDILVGLTATDDSGNQASAETKLHVFSKSDPKSYFRLGGGVGLPDADEDWQNVIDQDHLMEVIGGNWGISATIKETTSRGNTFSLDFTPPMNKKLEPGLYLNASYPADTYAGFIVSSNGFVCDFESDGSFEILKIENNGNVGLTQFHARFYKMCNQFNDISISGEIAYKIFDPNVPTINIAAPSQVWEADVVTLDASDSVDTIGVIETYRWTGPDNISIQNSSGSVATFVAPDVVDANSVMVTFKLHVTDNEGYQAEKNVTITVLPHSKDDPSADSGGGAFSYDYFIFLILLIIRNVSKNFNSQVLYKDLWQSFLRSYKKRMCSRFIGVIEKR